jgi:hypothetical protein
MLVAVVAVHHKLALVVRLVLAVLVAEALVLIQETAQVAQPILVAVAVALETILLTQREAVVLVFLLFAI